LRRPHCGLSAADRPTAADGDEYMLRRRLLADAAVQQRSCNKKLRIKVMLIQNLTALCNQLRNSHFYILLTIKTVKILSSMI
jgi:hypothetical protein